MIDELTYKYVENVLDYTGDLQDDKNYYFTEKPNHVETVYDGKYWVRYKTTSKLKSAV